MYNMRKLWSVITKTKLFTAKHISKNGIEEHIFKKDTETHVYSGQILLIVFGSAYVVYRTWETIKIKQQFSSVAVTLPVCAEIVSERINDIIRKGNYRIGMVYDMSDQEQMSQKYPQHRAKQITKMSPEWIMNLYWYKKFPDYKEGHLLNATPSKLARSIADDAVASSMMFTAIQAFSLAVSILGLRAKFVEKSRSTAAVMVPAALFAGLIGEVGRFTYRIQHFEVSNTVYSMTVHNFLARCGMVFQEVEPVCGKPNEWNRLLWLSLDTDKRVRHWMSGPKNGSQLTFWAMNAKKADSVVTDNTKSMNQATSLFVFAMISALIMACKPALVVEGGF